MADPRDLILVVDDDLSVLEVFALTLAQGGLNVATASSGGEALAKVEELKPRLVLLDLMLPDYGGLEVIELMRRRDPAEIPSVIVITGRFSDAQTREALSRASNVVAYLEKPIRPSELLDHARKALGARPAPVRPTPG